MLGAREMGTVDHIWFLSVSCSSLMKLLTLFLCHSCIFSFLVSSFCLVDRLQCCIFKNLVPSVARTRLLKYSDFLLLTLPTVSAMQTEEMLPVTSSC